MALSVGALVAYETVNAPDAPSSDVVAPRNGGGWAWGMATVVGCPTPLVATVAPWHPRERSLSAAEQEAADKLTADAAAQTEAARAARRQAVAAALVLEEEQREVGLRRAELTEALSVMEPRVAEAQQALADISLAALRELKAYTTPPVMVARVLEAVTTVLSGNVLHLGVERQKWAEIKKIIGKDNFVPSVRDFDSEKMSADVVARLEKLLDEGAPSSPRAHALAPASPPGSPRSGGLALEKSPTPNRTPSAAGLEPKPGGRTKSTTVLDPKPSATVLEPKQPGTARKPSAKPAVKSRAGSLAGGPSEPSAPRELLTYESAMRGSKAAGPLYTWAVVQRDKGRLLQQLRPQRDELAALTKAVARGEKAIADAKDDIDAKRKAVMALKRKFHEVKYGKAYVVPTGDGAQGGDHTLDETVSVLPRSDSMAAALLAGNTDVDDGFNVDVVPAEWVAKAGAAAMVVLHSSVLRTMAAQPPAGAEPFSLKESDVPTLMSPPNRPISNAAPAPAAIPASPKKATDAEELSAALMGELAVAMQRVEEAEAERDAARADATAAAAKKPSAGGADAGAGAGRKKKSTVF
jgi:hypothetical protein